MPLTRSEELVARLARRTFLSLWSEPNPVTRPGKELCDLLVVCDPDVVIFSVKEVALGDSGDSEVAWDRWRNRAIEGSAKQIYGAERWIRRAQAVVRADGSPGLALPPADRLRIHRVAVALGARGEVLFEQKDFGKGFVHVLDDQSLECVLGELDTVTDFVSYLTAKEALIEGATLPLLTGSEADLLAIYLHQGRRFPQGVDFFLVEPGVWEQLTSKPEWVLRKAADRESRLWDGLIETLIELTGVPGAEGAQDLATRERVFRVMAREDRFSRHVLASSFNEFMAEAVRERVRARIVPSPSGVAYVFLACARDEPRDHRMRELGLRCFVARGMVEQAARGAGSSSSDPGGARPRLVVGLATERYARDQGFSIDTVLVDIAEWTAADQAHLEGIQADLGYFAAPRFTSSRVDEYPSPDPGEALQRDQRPGLQAAPDAPRMNPARPGRNDPCPCGSGRKFKRCHGVSGTS